MEGIKRRALVLASSNHCIDVPRSLLLLQAAAEIAAESHRVPARLLAIMASHGMAPARAVSESASPSRLLQHGEVSGRITKLGSVLLTGSLA